MAKLPSVRDCMDRSFATVEPETRMHEALKLLVDKRLTGVLVVDREQQLRGVLSEKDCLKLLLAQGFERVPDDVVEAYMHPVPMTIESVTDVVRAAQVFLENDLRRLPVVDGGRLVGQITRRDIIKRIERDYT